MSDTPRTDEADDPTMRITNRHERLKGLAMALECELAEALSALREVVAISDRKHDAWDRAHAVLTKENTMTNERHMSKGDERAAIQKAFDKYAEENAGTVFSGRVYSHQAPFYLLLFEAGWQARGQQEPISKLARYVDRFLR